MTPYRGFKNALSLLKKTAREVPSYKRFLSERKINISDIETRDDFSTVPPVNKDNYLRKYPLEDLVVPNACLPLLSSSSGSSGDPYFWPRGKKQDTIGAKLHLRILTEVFNIKPTERTLVIVCFSMGPWIAGVYTAISICDAAIMADLNISIVTPGIDREDIERVYEKLAPRYDRIVWAGYPPFVMDILTFVDKKNPSILKKKKHSLLLAGENFSEQWRDQALGLIREKNPFESICAIYGTADAGIMGHETPLSVYIRRKAQEVPELWSDLFGDAAGFTPTFVQYDPQYVYAEEQGGELIFTTASGIPLIRYQIKDRGRILTFRQVKKILQQHNLWSEVTEHSHSEWNYPFIVLFGRSDVAASFYALNVYPENIKGGLENSAVFRNVTGKFYAYVSTVKKDHTQQLNICVQLKRGKKPSAQLKKRIQKHVTENMVRQNAEYRKLHSVLQEQALPVIKLFPFENEQFKIGKTKFKWFSDE